jgi:hypothetical protein
MTANWLGKWGEQWFGAVCLQRDANASLGRINDRAA